MVSKKVSGQGMMGATQMAGDRVVWHALVKTTAARPPTAVYNGAEIIHKFLSFIATL